MKNVTFYLIQAMYEMCISTHAYFKLHVGSNLRLFFAGVLQSKWINKQCARISKALKSKQFTALFRKDSFVWGCQLIWCFCCTARQSRYNLNWPGSCCIYLISFVVFTISLLHTLCYEWCQQKTNAPCIDRWELFRSNSFRNIWIMYSREVTSGRGS